MVFAGSPASEQQQAAAIVASWFGSRSAWRGQQFPVHYNQLPSSNAIVFATNDNRPDFLNNYPAVDAPVVGMMTHPAYPQHKLLLILGRDDQDLLLAAKGIAQGNILFRGERVVVKDVKQLAARKPYDAPNWVRTDRPVTFAELKTWEGQLQSSGVDSAAIDVALNLPPDLFLLRNTGIDMHLKYRYTAPPVVDGAQMDISLNNQFLQSVWALLRRQAELDGMPAINAKRVYRIMRQNALLLERKTAVPPSKRAHTGKVAVKESNQRWCSDGFEFRCDNGEKLRVTFALDCCDREALHWAVTTGGFDSETVQDVMLGAVERRFGNELPASPVEWLTDNGSCYRANETRQFARMLGLEPKNTAVRSPESNGIAESFVKTIKRDYISIMPKPDGLTAAKNLAEAFEHYNEWHPHSALGYRSPREYLRQQASNGLSDNRCLEI